MEYKTAAGRAVGFDIDLANAIAKNWKIKAKFVETGFPGLLPGLAAKRCTVVISGIFITPDRLALSGDRLVRNLLPERGAKLGTALKATIKTLKKNGTLKKIAAKHQIPATDVK